MKREIAAGTAALLFIMGIALAAFPAAAQVTLVPLPLKVAGEEGVFTIDSDTAITADAGAMDVARYFAGLLEPALGGKPGVLGTAEAGDRKDNTIIMKIDPGLERLGPEGYLLSVKPGSVKITAAAAAGAFYAVQTIRQMLPPGIEDGGERNNEKLSLPCVEIEDVPRFGWRGLMLDTARHFQPKEFVIKYIDAMVLFKLNHLHLHLTDDQGWRIEIKKFPSLTKIGAWRGKSTIADELSMVPSGEPHGGFYTQDDIREIVEHAASRFVTVVPEIEMPGHAQAALASVPGISCTGEHFRVRTRWGVNREIFCAGSERTFNFLEYVLTEVADLFPGEYIHIGGDEVPKERWRECPKCQARIKELGLEDEDELQSYFISRIEKFVNSRGKKIIGWDEILEGGLPPRATVMSWRGTEGGIEAARQGHDVVMSPTSHCYLDYRQSPAGEPDAIGSPTSVLPLCRVYSFDPVPEELSSGEADHVLGVQGNLWTEYVEAASHAMYMTYPRAAAVAEVGWSQQGSRDYDGFKTRLASQLEHLEAMGVKYREPRETDDALCE